MDTLNTEIVVRDACRRFTSREEITAAGFVPGWHGEAVRVGDQAVVYGHGQWRLMIITKVTEAKVHGLFTTPGALAENDRIMGVYLDPTREAKTAKWAAEMAGRNWDWAQYVATHQPGDPWSPTERRGPNALCLDQRVIADHQAWIAEHPDRAEHIAAQVAKEVWNVQRDLAMAKGDRFAYVNVTKGSGDRTPVRTNLYVQG